MSIRTDSIILSSLLAAPLALGATVWNGSTSNDYAVAANWTPNAVPAGTDDLEIGISTPNPTVVTGNWNTQGTGIKTITGTGSVSVPAGRLLNNGVFNVSGGSFTLSGDYFIVGTGANGVGTFNHSAGTVSITHFRGFQLSDNAISQAGSSYNLSGTAVLNVFSDANNTDVNLRHIWIGKGGDIGGVNNGPVQITPAVTGDAFNVTGGTATFTKNPAGTQPSEIRISRNAGLVVSGGSATFKDYVSLTAGFQGSSSTNSRVEVSGGTLTLDGVPDIFLGGADPGKLIVSGGILNAESSLLHLGGASEAATGNVLMTGGTLKLAFIVSENGTFDYRGGDLYIEDNLQDILDSSTYPWFSTANAPGQVLVDYDPSAGIAGTTHIHLATVASGYNAWLNRYPTLSDTTTAGDPDGDGVSNLLEYIFDGNPTVASRAILPVASTTQDDFVFTFTRQAASISDTTQTFQYSTDLVNWTDVAVNTAAAGSVTITPVESSSNETVVVRVPKTQAPGGKLFGRMSAIKP